MTATPDSGDDPYATTATTAATTVATAVGVPPSIRFGRLARRAELTSTVVELTIADLHGLDRARGDEFFYVVVNRDGSALPAGWTIADHGERSPHDPIIGAYYTARRSRPERGELDLWVVRHGHPHGVGAHLVDAAPGTAVALWGPRHLFAAPRRAAAALLVADESGTAAVAGVIGSLPPTTAILAVLETADARHRLPLPDHPGLTVCWVYRRASGGGHRRLLAAVRQACAGFRPDVAFGAAESSAVRDVRRYVRAELGLARDAVFMTGYWRRRG